tara:strand:- start:253 stop:420 length:168 start_codon:yes stop_codon:yes gene_type:complete
MKLSKILNAIANFINKLNCKSKCCSGSSCECGGNSSNSKNSDPEFLEFPEGRHRD